MLNRLASLARRARSGLAPSGPRPKDVPARWEKTPQIAPGDRVCLFVSYHPSGRAPAHALQHARAWAEAGYQVILILALDRLDDFQADERLGFCNGVLIRENLGYDFGAWASAIDRLPELREASVLAIANDSVYGPLDGFSAMLARVEGADADVVGLTESLEIRPHLQSYMLFFKPRALKSAAFARFWRKAPLGGRSEVIQHCELPLAGEMAKGGLKVAALFPATAGDHANPSLGPWRELIEAGFPFVKVQLLRDNPRGVDIADWPAVVAARGYDPKLIKEHLATAKRRWPEQD